MINTKAIVVAHSRSRLSQQELVSISCELPRDVLKYIRNLDLFIISDTSENKRTPVRVLLTSSSAKWKMFFTKHCPKYALYVGDNTSICLSKVSLAERVHKLFELSNHTTYKVEDKSNYTASNANTMFHFEELYDAFHRSEPTLLSEGEWHIPFWKKFKEAVLIKITKDFKVSVPELMVESSVGLTIDLTRVKINHNYEGYELLIDLHNSKKEEEKLSSSFEHCAKVEYGKFIIYKKTIENGRI